MIRRLQRVKTFGSFHDFTWPATLHDFKKFNLIFGWNYSGKTTFTRSLRCFELKKHHDDFPDAEVQFCVADGTIHNLSTASSPHLFRVFNVDFVRDNIRFESGSAEAILVLGAEDIAKQEDLLEKQKKLSAAKQTLFETMATRKVKREALDSALTSRARGIKNELNRPNYDRTKFEPRVEDRKDDHSKFILPDDELQKYIDTYRSTDKKDSLTRVAGASLTQLSVLRTTTASLLARTVTESVPISRLTDAPKVERWVNEGRPLHVGKNNCQFCDQPLPSTLLVTLKAHFSADYDELMTDLKSHLSRLERAAKESIPLPHKSNFYSEQGSAFEFEERELDAYLKDRRKSIQVLIDAVTEKQTKAFKVVLCPTIADDALEIAAVLKNIDALVTTHNERTAEFETNRNAAFEKLETHYASLFAQDNRYSETLKEIDDLALEVDTQEEAVDILKEEIENLERELSDAVKGAGTINEFMRSYFGKADLKITTVDNRFQITRNNVPAKNLSEGERTAVAFAYFMTRVLDGKNPLANTTVIIDDPIGSLDANHLFNTYAFIKTKLSGCFQLFILTHNFEFYSLIREWALHEEERRKTKPQTDWRDWSIYLIRRGDDGQSILEVIPDQLLKFNSEYHYLFATLLAFEKSTQQTFDNLMSLPNMARRFLEAFGGVMIPTHGGLHSKLPRLFADPVERERVWKFISNYSHNTSIIRALVVPDVSECKAVVTSCLTCVRQWDEDYYRDLESSIQ